MKSRSVIWSSAVCPAEGVDLPAVEGYRPDTYHNAATGLTVPALVAAADVGRVFELFLALLEPLGPMVDVVLESSHAAGHVREWRRRGIDRAVLASHLYDYEQLLLTDGCAGIAVVAPRGRMEVQFDEHKHLLIYARNRRPFRDILRDHGLKRHNGLELLFEVPHLHRSEPGQAATFRQLALRLGTGERRRRVS